MKTCSKCGELNGDNNTKCYKCGERLPAPVTGAKRYCKYCKGIYMPNVEECPRCEMPTHIYSEGMVKNLNSGDSLELWMFVVAFLIPIVGFVLGCIRIGKGDNDGGKKLIITSVISVVLYVIIIYAMASRSNAELDAALKELESMK